MIHPHGWYFLMHLPELDRANRVTRELDACIERGERSLVHHGRITGTLIIAALAAFTSVAVEHTWLARGSILVLTVAWLALQWQQQAFADNFRRTEYLRGYSQAKAGQEPSPP